MYWSLNGPVFRHKQLLSHTRPLHLGSCRTLWDRFKQREAQWSHSNSAPVFARSCQGFPTVIVFCGSAAVFGPASHRPLAYLPVTYLHTYLSPISECGLYGTHIPTQTQVYSASVKCVMECRVMLHVRSHGVWYLLPTQCRWRAVDFTRRPDTYLNCMWGMLRTGKEECTEFV